MRKIILLTLLSFSGAALPETVNYVTDSLKLEARTGPSTEHKIVQMLPTGSRVVILEERDGYHRVRLPGGEEAWMLARFLMREPAARDRLSAAIAKLDEVQKENTQLNTELGELRKTLETSEALKGRLASDGQQLTRELDEIKRAAANTISIKNDNEKLTSTLANKAKELEEVQAENTILSNTREQEWFIAGAWVLLGGMALGFIIPKIRWKRRRSWGEL